MTGQVVLIVLDGLGYETAVGEMGFLEGLVETGRARRWRLACVLPSLSRPTYATLLTGLLPIEHGITGNGVVRSLCVPTLFSRVADAGRLSAAVAYAWIHELAVGAPFDPVRDGEYDDGAGAIGIGRFHQTDAFPDQEAVWQAERIMRRHRPDFLFLHLMGCDAVGHQAGGGSLPYRRVAAAQDEALSLVIPRWCQAGYRIVVTADHGMDEDGHHGGTSSAARHVPLYLIGPDLPPQEQVFTQLDVAPLVTRLLGASPPDPHRGNRVPPDPALQG